MVSGERWMVSAVDGYDMEITFERMRNRHLESVMAIENCSFPTPWSKSAFSHEINSNDFAFYLVALAAASVVGYAGIWFILDEGHVTTLAVHPDYRRMGIGRRLLGELVREARRRGCTKMTLEARPSNKPALSLYGKAGFVSHGLRPGYYSDTGEDAVIMWKEL